MAASAKGSVSPPLSNSTNSTTEASSQINNTRGTASKRKVIPLRDVQLSADVEFSVMAMRMKDKFEKYWGDIEKMNMLVFVGCVFDPRRVIEIGGEDQTSELDKYLGEAVENYDDEFDILSWWKVNSPRFPVLSNMAKDVLAIPLSTVASESAFSTGGRVLDQFRSSLTPKMVQALVCTQDYIKKSSTEEEIKKFEEQIQELDKIDNGFCTAAL
ncbi:Detected protein of unknown function [Hibiscus syriacus]|uniref:HAT C-terminal dimerisation domain-containing protein n=1 Tax=Hibiscus syriacus TaxID=106335 RepID=A0A6A2X3B6_HIBSY|nr:Detected protein of unknown function [Hibiscus syriacus]